MAPRNERHEKQTGEDPHRHTFYRTRIASHPWTVASVSPAGTREASIWETTTSGFVAVAGGAVMLICWVRNSNPVGRAGHSPFPLRLAERPSPSAGRLALCDGLTRLAWPTRGIDPHSLNAGARLRDQTAPSKGPSGLEDCQRHRAWVETVLFAASEPSPSNAAWNDFQAGEEERTW